ncbi:hypothetical protein, partial [uncultured Nitrospira sp.]|uniref:hypothetical protein n=1 Tax=uncultured Nitrospira sp. TaxID=157176 RepID=UPI0031409543
TARLRITRGARSFIISSGLGKLEEAPHYHSFDKKGQYLCQRKMFIGYFDRWNTEVLGHATADSDKTTRAGDVLLYFLSAGRLESASTKPPETIRGSPASRRNATIISRRHSFS